MSQLLLIERKVCNEVRRKESPVLSEIEGRTGDYNTGGSSQTKILSAYKENCIHIACCLLHNGPLSPKVLREMGTGEKTLSILSKNYDGWFERVKRGTYTLSETGKRELQAFPDLMENYVHQNFKFSLCFY